MSRHIFGLRHHGPGSARSLRAALEDLEPDILLVEGPPDAEPVLPLLTHAEMRPPVALLIYRPDEPRRAAFYPFAVFSPEWQALHYGLSRRIPVRFMDLPQAHQLVDDAPPVDAVPVPSLDGESDDAAADESADAEADDQDDTLPVAVRRDPLGWLAEAAGDSDGEAWWERMVEQRRDSRDLFAAILEAMTAVRAETPPSPDPHEAQREAYMRQTIRAAEAEGFQRLAIVCGAWHGPALVDGPPAAEDAALLKSLPKATVAAAWVPWTDERLAFASGYGAGVTSPGWYRHLWETPTGVAPRWLTRVARLLREEDLDASAAHVIEAVRLAETLAALRGRAMAGLAELNEATLAVLCHGNDLPMRLIHQRLIVGTDLGAVPAEAPMVPLQADLAREQRRLRLPAEATQRVLDLDLRGQTDLGRSHLLHRLTLLEVPWGHLEPGSRTTTSTFHEIWRLQWQPELAVAVVAAGVWGNTIAAAATARAIHDADHAPNLATLTRLIDATLLADLPTAVSHLMVRVQEEMARGNDVGHLMEALPPLAGVRRYGNVRQTDVAMVGQVVDGLVARICIGLPGACTALDDEAAAAMIERLGAVNTAVGLLQQPDHQAAWQAALRQVADLTGVHGLVAGRCCRLLLDTGAIDAAEAARRLGLALSLASEPAAAAAWIDGLLRGSGQLLLHDETLWSVIDEWVSALPATTFTALLPLVRRTFASFSAPERRQMGQRVRSGPARAAAVAAATDLDLERADAVLPLLARLLGVG